MIRTDRIRAAAATVLLALAVAACSGHTQAGASRDRAVLLVESPVADAVLWVDGRYVAQLRDVRRGLALAPGRHQVEIRHDRYHAYYGEVELARGQRLRLAIELAEILP